MNPTTTLHDLGQSLWLDNITRDLLNGGTLQSYIDQLSVTGLTSNPTIFDHAIRNSSDYDTDIARLSSRAKSVEDLFFELALADLTRAADLLQPVFTRTNGVDGWVSRADIHGGPEQTLQSEAGYIDARPHSRQIDENLLQHTAAPYIRVRNGGPSSRPRTSSRNDGRPGLAPAIEHRKHTMQEPRIAPSSRFRSDA